MPRKNTKLKHVPHIFISHASADKDLIDAFVDLLQTGIGLNHEQVFCTSLEGMGIPKGKDFIKFIHEKIQNPFLIIMVVTPSYYESSFCLCELGAAWAMSYSSFPLICPPLEYYDLEAVLKNKEVGKIDSPSDLDSLCDRIIEEGDIENPIPTSRWNFKRDQFLKKLKKIIPDMDGFSKISIEKYTEVREAYETALQEVLEKEEKLDNANNTIKKLKRLKNTQSVKDILLADMDEWDQFKALKKDAKDYLNKLPNIAVEALYYEYYGGSFNPSFWNKDWLRDELGEAHERGYISYDEDEAIELNYDNLRVSKAIEKLDNLANFLAQSSTDFDDDFVEEHEFDPNLKLRDFWEKHLGLV